MSTRLLFTKYKTSRKSRCLVINSSILLKQGKVYLPCFHGYLLGIKKEDKPCPGWEELTISLLHRVLRSCTYCFGGRFVASQRLFSSRAVVAGVTLKRAANKENVPLSRCFNFHVDDDDFEIMPKPFQPKNMQLSTSWGLKMFADG